MKYLLDVHVLLLDNSNPIYLAECCNSLRFEPVNIWYANGVNNDIGEARSKAFLLGEAKYVSYVDPDDRVIPGSFQKCIDYLEANPSCPAVYTDEKMIDEDGDFIMNGWSYDDKPFLEKGYNPELLQGIHHLLVMRRDILLKCLPLKSKRVPEPVLTAELRTYGALEHLHFFGYEYRIHGKNTFSSHTAAEIEEALNLVRRFNSCVARGNR